MKSYEALFIIRPDPKEAEISNILKSITDVLGKNKAEVNKEDNWGERQLAYPIKTFRKGLYYKINFQAHPVDISKLKEAYALNSDILRIMITRK